MRDCKKVAFLQDGRGEPSPTVCMSMTLFAVGADSISALLMFREHMECSPTVFGVKILFVNSHIVTELTVILEGASPRFCLPFLRKRKKSRMTLRVR